MSWRLGCPDCRAPLGALPDDGTAEAVDCPACGRRYVRQGEVWDFMTGARSEAVGRFLDEYGRVRRAEGRGYAGADGYLALPYAPASDPLHWQWQVRARSYEHLVERVLDAEGRGGLRVVDLGAGTGWLSYRLALAGHEPLAVDLSADEADGLGAAAAYANALGRPFARVRADFDRLPLGDGVADVAVYNASLHYSADYEATLAEALRVLAPAGRVVVMDSPVYGRRRSGERMVAERKSRFRRLYGFASDALGSREFLTDDEVGRLGARLGIAWSCVEVPYGLRWHARRFLTRLRRGREAARFVLWVGRRAAAAANLAEVAA